MEFDLYGKKEEEKEKYSLNINCNFIYNSNYYICNKKIN
jgi:hypothetical protein